MKSLAMRAAEHTPCPTDSAPKRRPKYLQLSSARQHACITALVIFATGFAAWKIRPTSAGAPALLGASLKPSAQQSEAVRRYDVLVVGGTPSGVAAALAAARRGARVLLCEEKAQLGGDITYALLNMFDVPMSRSGRNPVSSGIFGEVFRELGAAFDVQRATRLFESKVAAEPNITLLRRAHVVGILKQGSSSSDRVIGARVQLSSGQVVRALAPATVDATNDADFAARAGASYFVGRQASGIDKRMQAASLLFEIIGADWNAMKRYVAQVREMPVAARVAQENASDAAPTTSKRVAASALKTPAKKVRHILGGGEGGYIWERGDVVRGYKPRAPRVMALSINFGRQASGDVVLNTLNVLGVNGLVPKSRAQGHAILVNELKSFVPYLRRAMPGLEKISLRRVAPELYIRETRHIQGFASLTVDDIRAQRQFPDAVARVSYPIDLHPYKKGDINPFGPRRYIYTLPLRSLIPRRVDGIFVASRCLSASYDAAGSARVIPITMAAGEAAGAAATMCAQRARTPHQIAKFPAWWAVLRADLRARGADVGSST